MTAPGTHDLRAAGAPAVADLQFVISEEGAGDLEAIDALTHETHRSQGLSRPSEHRVVRGLRDASALTLSLVATIDGQVIGHAAFSPVQIDGATGAWWGLGPVSVAPSHQRSGVGGALVRSGLRRLAARGVAGCVVQGDLACGRRFGFVPAGALHAAGPKAGHLMAWSASGELPTGRVTHHAAFDVDPWLTARILSRAFASDSARSARPQRRPDRPALVCSRSGKQAAQVTAQVRRGMNGVGFMLMTVSR